MHRKSSTRSSLQDTIMGNSGGGGDSFYAQLQQYATHYLGWADSSFAQLSRISKHRGLCANGLDSFFDRYRLLDSTRGISYVMSCVGRWCCGALLCRGGCARRRVKEVFEFDLDFGCRWAECVHCSRVQQRNK